MGTTAAIIDATPGPGCSPYDTRGREMDAVLSHCWPSFYRNALRRLGNPADAEDAVQDALLSAYKHLSQFRGQAHITTWLTAIVNNSARMQLRRRPRQPHVPLDEQHRDRESYSLSERLPAPGLSPEEVCRNSELTRHVLHLAHQLSPTLHRAFQLRELDGLSIREMVNILGVPEGTVKAQLARARARIRSLMRKRLGAGSLRRGVTNSLAAAPKNNPALSEQRHSRIESPSATPAQQGAGLRLV